MILKIIQVLKIQEIFIWYPEKYQNKFIFLKISHSLISKKYTLGTNEIVLRADVGAPHLMEYKGIKKSTRFKKKLCIIYITNIAITLVIL